MFQGSRGEGSASKFMHVAVGRTQVPTGCWPEAEVPRHMDSHRQLTTWQLASLRVKWVSERDRKDAQEESHSLSPKLRSDIPSFLL